MAITIPDAGVTRTITRGTVKVAGIERSLKKIEVWDGGALRLVGKFADPMAVSANDVRTYDLPGSPANLYSTAVATGGFTPYTYAWMLITNGGGSASTASDPAMATTTFEKTTVPGGPAVTDTWRVTVADATGETASADISVSFKQQELGE